MLRKKTHKQENNKAADQLLEITEPDTVVPATSSLVLVKRVWDGGC